MVLKLVRTDTENPCKIPLSVGTHLIGRGKLLDCEDKRISRNHGNLCVVDDAVTLKSLHQNPCFYEKKNIPGTQILKQDCEVTLSNGDKFGLLPDSYWYEILLCTDIDLSPCPRVGIEESGSIQENISNTENYVDHHIDDRIPLNIDINESSNQSQGPESPSVISTENQQLTNIAMVAEANSHTYINNVVDAHSVNQNILDSSTNPGGSRTPKRPHSIDEKVEEEEKKIKVDPEDVKPDVQPSSSGNQSTLLQPGAGVPQIPPSPQKPQARERCIYGGSCYRKNPQHRLEFSHPADGDWGPGERGLCPWGRTCRRRDPRHWQHHDHPPGTLPPGNRQGKNTKRPKAPPKPKKKDSDDDSQSDNSTEDVQNLIVTGKRKRKPIKLSTSWNDSDDEGEVDPYQTDESDEWQPTNDVTASQDYSQDFE